MQILKAYKFRLEPTEQQAQRLRQLGGCARYVWNHGLAETKRILDAGEKLPSAFELNRMLTSWKKDPEMAFLAEAYTDNLQQKLKDLHGAWMRCFDKKLAAKAPVFKKKATTATLSGSSTSTSIAALKGSREAACRAGVGQVPSVPAS